MVKCCYFVGVVIKLLGIYNALKIDFLISLKIVGKQKMNGGRQMKRALILASVASMIDQFNMHNISILEEMGFKVDVACNFEEGSATSQERVNEFKRELEIRGVGVTQIPIPRKLVAFGDMKKSYNLIKSILEKNRYEIVHCHSPIGGAITRLACRKSRKSGTKVIYTAHGFHFYSGAPIKNWLLFYPVEKLCSLYTDVLITINQEDYERAKRKFCSPQIVYVPGVGIDVKSIADMGIDIEKKREELGIPKGAVLILSVGEINVNKNHEVIIRAIKNIGNSNIYYIICGKGQLEERLKLLISDLGLEKQVGLLGFRKDIIEIGKCADIFAFPSKREGLGVAALEAMANGLSLITSNVHGIVDYAKNGETGFCCRPEDVEGFTYAIKKLIESPELNKKMGQHNLEVVKKFDINNVNCLMKKIYMDV